MSWDPAFNPTSDDRGSQDTARLLLEGHKADYLVDIPQFNYYLVEAKGLLTSQSERQSQEGEEESHRDFFFPSYHEFNREKGDDKKQDERE